MSEGGGDSGRTTPSMTFEEKFWRMGVPGAAAWRLFSPFLPVFLAFQRPSGAPVCPPPRALTGGALSHLHSRGKKTAEVPEAVQRDDEYIAALAAARADFQARLAAGANSGALNLLASQGQRERLTGSARRRLVQENKQRRVERQDSLAPSTRSSTPQTWVPPDWDPLARPEDEARE